MAADSEHTYAGAVASSGQSHPGARLVLLGASNLTRAISTVIETSRLMFSSPLEIFAAIGHGRSYGMRSRVLLRELPSILECGLWDALAQTSTRTRAESSKGEKTQTFALITDVGNDIIYGASPQKVAAWVEQCIERLLHHGASIAMTSLPIESIRAVQPWQFTIVKTMLFPRHKLTYEDAIRRANELHDLIVDLAQRRDVRIVESRATWYGFDPIHIRMRNWSEAWSEILSTCAMCGGDDQRCAKPSISRWLRLRMMTPQKWWLAGREMSHPQPAGRFADGTVISLF